MRYIAVVFIYNGNVGTYIAQLNNTKRNARSVKSERTRVTRTFLFVFRQRMQRTDRTWSSDFHIALTQNRVSRLICCPNKYTYVEHLIEKHLHFKNTNIVIIRASN